MQFGSPIRGLLPSPNSQLFAVCCQELVTNWPLDLSFASAKFLDIRRRHCGGNIYLLDLESAKYAG
jgi:hypothetical protein